MLAFVIPLGLAILITIIIVLARQSGKKAAARDTRPTSQKASSLLSTRGSEKETPKELEKQLETGQAPEDVKPSPGFSASQVIKDTLSDPVVYGAVAGGIALDVVNSKIAKAIDKRALNLSKNALNQAISTGGERAVQRLGMKIATGTGERAAIKAATAGTKAAAQAGSQLATKAATAASTGPGAPIVMAAEIAFGMFTNGMDALNLGGFNNLSTNAMNNDMRDTIDDYFKKELGNKIPLVYGPLDKLTTEEYTKLISETTVDLIKNDKNKPSDLPDSYVERKVDEATQKLCKDKGGQVFLHPNSKENACSFKKSDCVAPWPQQAGDTYYEFKDNVCQVRPSVMKSHCEGLGEGVTYNIDTGSCYLTPQYCQRYGSILSRGDCNINKGQQIAEAIFGKTLTRSIVNIFDFKNNYEKCPPGTNEPNELNALNVIPGLGLAATGAIALGAQYMCSGARCKEDEEMMMQTLGDDKKLGGFCYPKCKPGYSSNWRPNDRTSAVAGMCYADCPPGTDPTAAACTRLHQNRTDTGRTADCPSGWSKTSEGMCQPNCTDPGFTKSWGGLCYHDSVDTNLLVKGTTPGNCPDGYETAGAGLCSKYRENCTAGLVNCKYTKSRCYCTKIVQESIIRPNSCPNGYEERAGMCYAMSRPIKPAKSTIEVGTCRSDEDKVNGQCYPKCDKYGGSFTRLPGTGTCQMTSLTIPRDSYTRTPRPAYSVFPKKRNTKFPSTSESDFKNSTLGKYIQAGINSIRDGDPKGFGKALGGMALVGNPAVLGLGMQDLADIGYQEALNA